MIGLALTLLSIVATFQVTRRRGLGHGLGTLLLVGYFYGILRARHPDGFSHFMFDGAVAGLYLSILTGRMRKMRVGRDGQVMRLFVRALMVWPLCTLFISPFFDSQHFFIQLVGLRMAILLLPLIVIASRLTEEELDSLGEWVLWLNAVAFVFAMLQLRFGVEPFFPRNSVTDILYKSNDVGEERSLRIPAIFNTAHAYGGTMLLSLPLLVRRWERRASFRDRLFTGLVLAGSVLGLFICAARSPVVQLLAIVGGLLLVTRLSLKLIAGLAGIAVLVGVVVLQNPRFQRFLTLDDSGYVSDRVAMSVNTSLLDVITNYPLGNGLGSAAGTSIPFFLSHLARPQVGFENEYARITMEQGLIGLLLWLCFLGWLFTRLPPRRRGGSIMAERMMWATVLVMWATAIIGTGTLSSIPGTTFLLFWMGIIVGTRRPVTVPRPRPAVSRATHTPRPPMTVPGPGLPEDREVGHEHA
ncbi:hypothetical protein JQX13_23225 [Archangium violaceum]|uniref:O-antigen ligase family protein n=1 Tax=Archangium violaceum TaxID=83451 RepID=UPI00193B3BE2|nr:hypothetical protein [Archangium violaceum]QRK12686.1 hypothetical protein JQX13_23225 [Archangium violaceum]